MTSPHISQKLRDQVSKQARHRCGYCLSAANVIGLAMQLDHLLPQALGGTSSEQNLWLACSACNAFKGSRISARDPESGQMVRLFNPRGQIWQEHFQWVEAGARIVGRTPAGRATTYALRLNRPLLVKARRSWIKAGWHPPQD
jgi:hypothetical protein